LIRAVIPYDAFSGAITVRVNDIVSNAIDIRVPVINSVSHTWAAPGVVVDI